MKNKIFIVCLFHLVPCSVILCQVNSNALLQYLTKVIDSTDYYDAHKNSRILQIKSGFRSAVDKSLLSQYKFNEQLYEEYKLFQFDSALVYVKRLEEISKSLNDSQKIAETKMKLLFALVSAGLFKEAGEMVNEVDTAVLMPLQKAEYFTLKGRYYYDLAEYANTGYYYEGYKAEGKKYVAIGLSTYPPESFEYIFFNCVKLIQEGIFDKPYHDLQLLIHKYPLTTHQIALAASTLSYVYYVRGNIDSSIYYLVQAFIADIHDSTKEALSSITLTKLTLDMGLFTIASKLAKSAVRDATMYGSRQRKVQVSTLLPVVQANEMSFVKNNNRLWAIYGVVVSIFLMVLIFLIVVIRKKNTFLQKAQNQLSVAHQQLNQANKKLMGTNASLSELNAQLKELNRIKEEYIAYFFTMDSELFQKIDRLKLAIEEKLRQGKYIEIKLLLNTLNIKVEKERLVNSFDKVFLKIYPNFVEEFNALFEEGNKIQLQDGELMNTDLRIYALLRLGIKENEKIAEILQYSVKSIYTYKTKIRNRSFAGKEDFDNHVMQIKIAEIVDTNLTDTSIKT